VLSACYDGLWTELMYCSCAGQEMWYARHKDENRSPISTLCKDVLPRRPSPFIFPFVIFTSVQNLGQKNNSDIKNSGLLETSPEQIPSQPIISKSSSSVTHSRLLVRRKGLCLALFVQRADGLGLEWFSDGRVGIPREFSHCHMEDM